MFMHLWLKHFEKKMQIANSTENDAGFFTLAVHEKENNFRHPNLYKIFFCFIK